MRYQLFGRTGLRVSGVALGVATFGEGWGWGADPATSREVFDLFVEAGGTFFDVADVYQFGQSESILGDLVKADRDRFVIASKYGVGWQDDISRSGNNRKHMTRALEATLRRLDTDYLDLYLVHVPDGMTPLDEVVHGLHDLVTAGKVVYAGLSDFPAWAVARAATLADAHGWAPIVTTQFEYSLLERTVERELLPMATALDLAVTTWSPLGGGLLTGKYRHAGGATGEQPAPGRRDRGGGPFQAEDERAARVVSTVVDVAAGLGATPSQVAIAWVRHQPWRTTPILGARTADQLRDNLAALDLTLSPDALARLDEVSAVPLGFPHDMLRSELHLDRVTGGHAADLIRHR